MSFDSREFRSTLGLFATGVTVVSFFHQGEPAGMTVNSFTSVSLEPPLILFCPTVSCRFSEDLSLGKPFAVSVLSKEQGDVCLHFAGQPNLVESPWAGEGLDPERPPVIKDSLGWLQCRAQTVHQHGDHYVVVAAVEEVEPGGGGEPLLFYRGGYPVLETSSLQPG